VAQRQYQSAEGYFPVSFLQLSMSAAGVLNERGPEPAVLAPQPRSMLVAPQ